MACLNDKQIERLAERPDDPASARLREHVDACDACRQRSIDAAAEANLIDDVRELRERREGIQTLLEEMTGTGNPASATNDRV